MNSTPGFPDMINNDEKQGISFMLINITNIIC